MTKMTKKLIRKSVAKEPKPGFPVFD